MALFEFYAGKLVPAQFGVVVSQHLDAEVLEAIRAQVLEVIDRAIFPVAWANDSNMQGLGQSGYSLTALDYSGQIVSVEIISELNPLTMVSALSRLGQIAQQGWFDLISLYPGGPEAFQNSWSEFRESMPTNTAVGAKLYMVVGSIDPAVAPALGVLFSSGIEIHQVCLRQMSNGRRFLEVQQLQPGKVSNLAGIGVSRGAQRLATHTRSSVLPPATTRALHPQKDVLEENETSINTSFVAASVKSDVEEATMPCALPITTTKESSAPKPSSVRHTTAEILQDSEPLGRDARGLARLAEILGQDTVLLWRNPEGRVVEALLTVTGLIDPGNGQLSSNLNTAFWQSAGGVQQVDAWEALHLNTLDGPTVLEAITEINQKIGKYQNRHYSSRLDRNS